MDLAKFLDLDSDISFLLITQAVYRKIIFAEVYVALV